MFLLVQLIVIIGYYFSVSGFDSDVLLPFYPQNSFFAEDIPLTSINFLGSRVPHRI